MFVRYHTVASAAEKFTVNNFHVEKFMVRNMIFKYFNY